ncbi:MAG: hypothetical protein FJZ83_05090 [Chloroflexi bacterium]|nr:hypothetical protein [Chloroflexota bacterium]
MNKSLRHAMGAIFYPRAIAVAGASEVPSSFGYHFIRHLLDYGYQGHIYPVNPNKEVILGLKAYQSLGSITGHVDYVICCLPASKVVDMLYECRAKEVKVVHLLAAGLSETGRQEGRELEAEILRTARRFGIRLVGPNCLGIYHPKGGMASTYSLPQKPGPIGAVFQSGGASQLLVRSGELRGLCFSKVISYGNALDLGESDFLDYLAEDEETEVVASYFEGIKDGQKFLGALTNAARAKPLIAIKGGQGMAGAKAAASHTAAIAGSEVIWRTAFKKAGVTMVRDLDEMVDCLVAFSLLSRIMGNKAGILTTAGGGLCVMAADVCESAGLNVPPLPSDIRNTLKARAPGIWDWIGNPVDASLIVAGASSAFFDLSREMASILSRSPAFDFVLVELTDDNPFSDEEWAEIASAQTEALIGLHRENLKPLAVVVSGGTFGAHVSQYERWDMLSAQRARLVEAGVPTFSSMADAALAIRRYISYCSLSATE